MTPEATSEHLISKNFLGEHPPRSPYSCLLVCLYTHTYTLDINITPFKKSWLRAWDPFILGACIPEACVLGVCVLGACVLGAYTGSMCTGSMCTKFGNFKYSEVSHHL